MMATSTKLPRLTRAKLKAIAAAIPAHLAARRQDEENRRLKRGPYAPPTGKCVACGGAVFGQVKTHHSDRIGGPPPGTYVSHWECDACGLMYGRCPQ
jgi:hypothetical protein